MGIDVRFIVRPKEPLSEVELENLASDFRQEVGTNAVERIYEEAGLLHFYTLSRLYAEDYPRGNPIPWIRAAYWLDDRLPGCEVYYFGDCYDFDDMTQQGCHWTRESRMALAEHFFKVGSSAKWAIDRPLS